MLRNKGKDRVYKRGRYRSGNARITEPILYFVQCKGDQLICVKATTFRPRTGSPTGFQKEKS